MAKPKKPKSKPAVKAKPAKAKPRKAKSEAATKKLAKPPAGLPERLLENLLWSLSKKHYATAADFVAAVIAYNVDIRGACAWTGEASALPVAAVDLGITAVIDGAYDDAYVSLVAEGNGFTEGELLWKIHQAMIPFELSDKNFFEGLSLGRTSEERQGRPPLYFVRQGS